MVLCLHVTSCSCETMRATLVQVKCREGEFIRQTLVEARRLVLGRPIASYNEVLNAIREQFSDRDAEGRRQPTFDLRTMIHAVTAVEAELLDLQGQHLGVPMAALSGKCQQRNSVRMLGYLFCIGDRKRTNLPYRSAANTKDNWIRLRDEEALTPSAIVRLAEERYGFADFKLKGGVLTSDNEMAAVSSLAQ
jgi:glucarate dehydratase